MLFSAQHCPETTERDAYSPVDPDECSTTSTDSKERDDICLLALAQLHRAQEDIVQLARELGSLVLEEPRLSDRARRSMVHVKVPMPWPCARDAIVHVRSRTTALFDSHCGLMPRDRQRRPRWLWPPRHSGVWG